MKKIFLSLLIFIGIILNINATTFKFSDLLKEGTPKTLDVSEPIEVENDLDRDVSLVYKIRSLTPEIKLSSVKIAPSEKYQFTLDNRRCVKYSVDHGNI